MKVLRVVRGSDVVEAVAPDLGAVQGLGEVRGSAVARDAVLAGGRWAAGMVPG